MNWAELTAIQDLYEELQESSFNPAYIWTERELQAAEEAQIVAIERFATAVLTKWPEISEILTEAIPAPAVAKVARQFSQIAAEEIESGADSVVISIDKQKHGL